MSLFLTSELVQLEKSRKQLIFGKWMNQLKSPTHDLFIYLVKCISLRSDERFLKDGQQHIGRKRLSKLFMVPYCKPKKGVATVGRRKENNNSTRYIDLCGCAD